MDRNSCQMTFSEALEQYLDAREDIKDAPVGCFRWRDNKDKIKAAEDYMNALTSEQNEHPESP